MEAVVFNLQKFCIHDGPGIRTTIFFKGCPLSCLWCANPESQNARPEIIRDAEKCVQCLSCAEICPNDAMVVQSKKVQYHMENCTHCGRCVQFCPTGAIELCGKTYTLNEIMIEVLKDREFYEDSGGGVTFSGGEFLLQPDFVIALAEELHQHGIHVAAETSGFTVPEVFARVLRHIDLVLFDMKHYDRDKHRKTVGADPALIWQNLKLVLNSKKELMVRIPVIPGINDSLADAAGFAEKLKEFKQRRVQLLPFHQLGQKKYDLLGKEYKFMNVLQFTKEDLHEYQAVFRQNGIRAFF